MTVLDVGELERSDTVEENLCDDRRRAFKGSVGGKLATSGCDAAKLPFDSVPFDCRRCQYQ